MEEIISWIKKARNHAKTWEWIRNDRWENEVELQNFLDSQCTDNFWPRLSVSEWYRIVDEQKAIEEDAQRLADETGVTVIAADNEDNDIFVPQEEDSAWQCYKRHLIEEKDFGESTVKTIELSTEKILKQLSRDTRKHGPRKGLVIGNVQSGKTANMAALMAMAADWGWNMFIVLSGTIESLRIQTQNRLVNDLNQVDSKYHWNTIDNPKGIESSGHRAEDFYFTEGNKQCYLTVCLKNSTRLKNLVTWLHYKSPLAKNAPASMMKILVIDDEADQASINAATDPTEKTVINQLILNLINGKTNKRIKGQDNWIVAPNAFCAMNYIGYTATPYANVLNTPPGEDSLYPKNFIATLAVSDEYFGPQQIFGNKTTGHEGLSIIRIIADRDISEVKDIHDGFLRAIPDSLKDSVCWFICGVACMRYWQYKKPVTMLVHTSIKTNHHQMVADAINQWLQNTGNDNIIRWCQQVWNDETKRFSLKTFKDQYPEYAESNNVQDVKNYPSFNEIIPEIKKLLAIGVTDIKLNDDIQRPTYNNGIHLCIDNNTQNRNGTGILKRLVYPEGERDTATAFIVVGGQTLSRGLTIEGLISTFFLRSSITADTLMQMGRWFGYRRGYELLPRIWMSGKAQLQFEFLSDMDQRLRDEIQRMSATGANFAEIGPKIMKSPQASLIRIVSANKMKAAEPAEFDFSGHTTETGVFDNELDKLRNNLKKTSEFVASLGAPDVTPHINKHNIVWRNVDLSMITTYLKNYQFSSRIKGFNDLEPLILWLEQFTNDGKIGKWNVILAGNRTCEKVWEPVEGISINMINRVQRYKRNDNVLNISTLRSPDDFLSDVPDGMDVGKKIPNLAEINDIRGKAGLSSTPQLVLYIINKDSKPRSDSRFPLEACEDIAAFSINIPGKRSGSMVKFIQIQMPKNQNDIAE